MEKTGSTMSVANDVPSREPPQRLGQQCVWAKRSARQQVVGKLWSQAAWVLMRLHYGLCV